MFVTVSVILTALVAVLVLVALAAGILSLFGCRFRRVFVRGLWFLLLPVLLFFYGMLVERNIYKVSDVEVSSPGVPFGFDGYRIVQISDLHLRSFQGRPRSLERMLSKIGELNPDVVMFSGDLVTSSPDEIAPLAEILRGISAPDGVYSVMGNHDYCPYNRWESASEQAAAIAGVRRWERELGWRLLDNENAKLCRGGSEISLIGVENISAMPQFPSRGDLGRALEGADSDFKVLLSHDPSFWRQGVLGATDIDLTLSGHTHNAQLKLFGWEPIRLFFKENSGLYSERTDVGVQCLYVNDGLGETMFPARIGVPAEITLLTLRRREVPAL